MLQKLNDLSIFKRLLMSFLLLFLIIAGFGVFAVKQVTVQADMTDNLYSHPFRTTNSLLEAKAAIYNDLLVLREVIQEYDKTRRAPLKAGAPADERHHRHDPPRAANRTERQTA